MLILYFDGLCEPTNPGGVSVASWVVRLSNEKDPVISDGAVVADGGPLSTCNVAEWAGLVSGLEAILTEFKPRPEFELLEILMIRGDSKLVINQLTGRWAMRAAHLRPYLIRAREVLEELGCPWDAEWIPREKNEEADIRGRVVRFHYEKMRKKSG